AGDTKNSASANARTETKVEGGVKWKIIYLYLSSMGRWYFWVAAVLVFVAQQIGSIATSVWIRQWANQYAIEDINAADVGRRHLTIHNIRYFVPSSSYSIGCYASGSCAWNMPLSSQNYTTSVLNSLGHPEVDVGYYLGVYALLGIAYMLVSLARQAILFGGSLSASWSIHTRL